MAKGIRDYQRFASYDLLIDLVDYYNILSRESLNLHLWLLLGQGANPIYWHFPTL